VDGHAAVDPRAAAPVGTASGTRAGAARGRCASSSSRACGRAERAGAGSWSAWAPRLRRARASASTRSPARRASFRRRRTGVTRPWWVRTGGSAHAPTADAQHRRRRLVPDLLGPWPRSARGAGLRERPRGERVQRCIQRLVLRLRTTSPAAARSRPTTAVTTSRPSAGGDGALLLLRHRDEEATRRRHSSHAPMSTSLVGFHRMAGHDGQGRFPLVLERHGSLPVDQVRRHRHPLGSDVVLGPGARTRPAQRTCGATS
jgi:hypothetical protein